MYPPLRAVRLSSLLAFALVLGACGGGGDEESTSNPTNVRLSLVWAARSRVVEAPGSALSAVLTLSKPGGAVPNLVQTINRPDTTGVFAQELTTDRQVVPGAYNVSVRFYAEANGNGAPVGEAVAQREILRNGFGIGALTTAGSVARVELVPGQIAPLRQSRHLKFTAFDASGAIVAVSEGSAFWAKVSGGETIQVTREGLVLAGETGTVNVTATVDGVTSASTPVEAVPPPTVTNGGFEATTVPAGSFLLNDAATGNGWQGFEDWGIANGPGAWGTAAHGGTNYAFLRTSSAERKNGFALNQVSGLIVGERYRVSVWFARKNGNVGPNSGTSLNVGAGWTTLTNRAVPNSDGSWNNVTSNTFVAESPITGIWFETVPPIGDGDLAVLIDDVTIEFAPETE